MHNDARGDTVGRLSDRWRLAMGRSADLPFPQGGKTILFSVLGDVANGLLGIVNCQNCGQVMSIGTAISSWLIADSGSSVGMDEDLRPLRPW